MRTAVHLVFVVLLGSQLQDTFPLRAVTLTPIRLVLSCWFWLLPHCITASCSFTPISQESKTFWEKEGKLIYLQISSYLQKNIFQVNSIMICGIMLFNYKLKSKLKEDKDRWCTLSVQNERDWGRRTRVQGYLRLYQDLLLKRRKKKKKSKRI